MTRCDPSFSAPLLSVVIPTLNAGEGLANCLEALIPGLVSGLVREAVVCDGGSTDASVDIARDMGCSVIDAPTGRGRQLAAGAAHVRGSWFLFLHADTVLEVGWEQAVAAHISAGEDHAAAFTLAFDDPAPAARRVAALANWRARVLGLPYGDQGLLISRRHYEALGGYPDLPLMEDVALVRAIGRNRLKHLASRATTSAKRYHQRGWTLGPLRNLSILTAYLFGVSPQRLARWYR
jgi:rSAM/selenodomain-associated transferase 2